MLSTVVIALSQQYEKFLLEQSRRLITQRQAAVELGVSVRWVRKLLVRRRAQGDGALRHGLRGRASNRKMPGAVKRRAVEVYRQNEQAKLWRRRRARVEQVHLWQARRARYGELVQWDTGEHDWREGRGEKLYLTAIIQDATPAHPGAVIEYSREPSDQPRSHRSLAGQGPYHSLSTPVAGKPEPSQFPLRRLVVVCPLP